LCKLADQELCVAQGNVFLEGVFRRDRFVGAIGNDGVVVDAACEVVETAAIAAKVAFERGDLHRVEVADRCYADRFHACFRDLADSGNAADWER
jgi:hypothetical protein